MSSAASWTCPRTPGIDGQRVAVEKAGSHKTWTLASEPIYSTPLTSAEREKMEEFWVYKHLRGRDSRGMPTVTPAEARVQESAVQAVAGAQCQHYEGRSSGLPF